MGNNRNTLDAWHTHASKTGVIYRVHQERKFMRKPDCFWAIRYRVNSKRITTMLGWSSEGWNAEIAYSLLTEFKQNIKLGIFPQTLEEKRKLNEAVKKEKEDQAEQAALDCITFKELAEYYCEWAIKNRASGKSIVRLIELHILPQLGAIEARHITTKDIDELRIKLENTTPLSGRGKIEGRGLSNQTVLHCLKTVREIYNFAKETPHTNFPERMLFAGKNPAVLSKRGHGIRLPKYDARRLRILNEDETKSLLAYKSKNIIDSHNLHDMILFSLDTGVRSGELVRIRVEISATLFALCDRIRWLACVYRLAK